MAQKCSQGAISLSGVPAVHQYFLLLLTGAVYQLGAFAPRPQFGVSPPLRRIPRDTSEASPTRQVSYTDIFLEDNQTLGVL